MDVENFWGKPLRISHELNLEFTHAKSSDTFNSVQFDRVLQNAANILHDFFSPKSPNSVDRRSVESWEKSGQISKSILNEALIMSKLFNLNEIHAVQLIQAGELATGNHMEISRGLCGVLVFFNWQLAVVQCLKNILLQCKGRNFESCLIEEANKKLEITIKNEIWKSDMLKNILGLLTDFDVSKELDKLQQPNVKGLGNSTHRNLVVEAIISTYDILSECVMLRIAQFVPSEGEIELLANFLSKNKLNYGFRNIECNILTAFLYCLDVSNLENIDDERDVGLVCVGFNRSSINHMQDCVSGEWIDKGLQAIVHWAWAIAIRIIAQHFIAHTSLEDLTVDEEELFEEALYNKPFDTLRRYVVRLESFHSNQLVLHRIHTLVTQTIVNFPLKLKELRSRTEEELHYLNETQDKSNPVYLHFQQFLLMMSEIYEKDSLGTNLVDDFWAAANVCENDSFARQKVPQHQLLLLKFVSGAGEHLPAALYVAYLKMLLSLSSTKESALHAFNLIRNNGGSNISFDGVFHALHEYVNYFRSNVSHKQIHMSPQDLAGLTAWLNFIKIIAAQSESVSRQLCEYSGWSCLNTFFSLLSSPAPIHLKGVIYEVLASFAIHSSIIASLWQGIIQSKLIFWASQNKLDGVQRDLDEIESAAEEYPATIGFLKLISTLIEHPIMANDEIMQAILQFVIHSVFTFFRKRAYKNTTQMWTMGFLCVDLMVKLVENTDLTVENVNQRTPGVKIMTQVMSDSPIFRNIMKTLCDCCVYSTSEMNNSDEMQSCSLKCLQLLQLILMKEDFFVDCIRDAGSAQLVTPMHSLLQLNNPLTNNTDYINVIASYIDYHVTSPQHTFYALQIIKSLSKRLSLQSKLVRYLTSDKESLRIIQMGLAALMTLENVKASEENEFENIDCDPDFVRGKCCESLIECICTSLQLLPNQSNLAMVLLAMQNANKSNFTIQNPGVEGCKRSVVHGLMEMCESIIGVDSMESLPYCSIIPGCLNLLSLLTSFQSTSPSVSRFMRSHEIVPRLVQGLANLIANAPLSIIDCESLSGIVNLITNEIYQLTLAGHSTQLNLIVSALFSGVSHTNESTTIPKNTSLFDLSVARSENRTTGLNNTTCLLGGTKVGSTATQSSLILSILQHLDAKIAAQETPQLQYFDCKRLAQVMSVCTAPNYNGVQECNIQSLHSLLKREIAAVGPTHFDQLFGEMTEILEYAVVYNDIQRQAGATEKCIKSWETLLNTTLNCSGLEFQPAQTRLNIAAELMSAIAKKAMLPEASEFLVASACSAIMVVTQWIRTIFMANGEQSEIVGNNSLMNNSNANQNVAQFLQPAVKDAMQLLTKNDLSTESRICAYSSIMNLLAMAKMPNKMALESEKDTCKVLTQVCAREDWTRILDMIARDSCANNQLAQVVSLCCLCRLTPFTMGAGSIVQSNGLLQRLVESLKEDDPIIVQIIRDTNAPTGQLHVFVAKMTVFTQMANNVWGQRHLQSSGVINVLTGLRCLSQNASLLSESDINGDPDISCAARAYILHESVWGLCSLIQGNAVASQQLIHLGEALLEPIGYILQNIGRPRIVQHLALPGLVITTIARAWSLLEAVAPRGELEGIAEKQVFIDKCVNVLNIMCKSVRSRDSALNNSSCISLNISMAEIYTQPTDFEALEFDNVYYSILAEVLAFMAKLTLSSGDTALDLRPYFCASIDKENDGLPPLASVICALKTAVSEYESVTIRVKQLKILLENTNTDEFHTGLTPAQKGVLDKLFPNVMNRGERNILIQEHLLKCDKIVQEQRNLIRNIMETSSVILYRHLEYYLGVCMENSNIHSLGPSAMRLLVPATQNKCGATPTAIQQRPLPSIPGNQLVNLKQQVATVLTQSFLTSVIKIEKENEDENGCSIEFCCKKMITLLR